MRIIITTTQVPFLNGGAEVHAAGLLGHLREHGHQVEIVTMPFRFSPPKEVLRTMDVWASQSLDRLDCGPVDRVICLKFPSFYVQHDDKYIWLLHQHRSVYELYDTVYGESSRNPDSVFLREEVVRRDTAALKGAKKIFANSKRVASRMKHYNKVDSIPLYHPPRLADALRPGDQLPYIFCPSRLETLKRQELLIRAVRCLKSPCTAVLAGDGGQRAHLESLISSLGVRSRVRMLGCIDDNDKVPLYSNALGVFFGPHEEDYGYVTLEAMLSGKPVITCTDSGGPLEFVVDGMTGYVTAPSPEAVAHAIDKLFFELRRAKEMGMRALERYKSLNISWENVVCRLTGK